MWQTFSSYILNFLSGWFFMTYFICKMDWFEYYMAHHALLTPFHASGLFLYPLEISANQCLTDGGWQGVGMKWVNGIVRFCGWDRSNKFWKDPSSCFISLSQNQNLSLRFVFITLGISPGTSFKVEPSKEAQS